MKSAEEILNEYGCPVVPFDESVTMFHPAIIEAMREYAKQAIEEQLKIAAQEAKTREGEELMVGYEYRPTKVVDRQSILNCKRIELS